LKKTETPLFVSLKVELATLLLQSVALNSELNLCSGSNLLATSIFSIVGFMYGGDSTTEEFEGEKVKF
jgi:hypothetical protein